MLILLLLTVRMLLPSGAEGTENHNTPVHKTFSSAVTSTSDAKRNQLVFWGSKHNSTLTEGLNVPYWSQRHMSLLRYISSSSLLPTAVPISEVLQLSDEATDPSDELKDLPDKAVTMSLQLAFPLPAKSHATTFPRSGSSYFGKQSAPQIGINEMSTQKHPFTSERAVESSAKYLVNDNVPSLTPELTVRRNENLKAYFGHEVSNYPMSFNMKANQPVSACMFPTKEISKYFVTKVQKDFKSLSNSALVARSFIVTPAVDKGLSTSPNGMQGLATETPADEDLGISAKMLSEDRYVEPSTPPMSEDPEQVQTPSPSQVVGRDASGQLTSQGTPVLFFKRNKWVASSEKHSPKAVGASLELSDKIPSLVRTVTHPIALVITYGSRKGIKQSMSTGTTVSANTKLASVFSGKGGVNFIPNGIEITKTIPPVTLQKLPSVSVTSSPNAPRPSAVARFASSVLLPLTTTAIGPPESVPATPLPTRAHSTLAAKPANVATTSKSVGLGNQNEPTGEDTHGRPASHLEEMRLSLPKEETTAAKTRGSSFSSKLSTGFLFSETESLSTRDNFLFYDFKSLSPTRARYLSLTSQPVIQRTNVTAQSSMAKSASTRFITDIALFAVPKAPVTSAEVPVTQQIPNTTEENSINPVPLSLAIPAIVSHQMLDSEDLNKSLATFSPGLPVAEVRPSGRNRTPKIIMRNPPIPTTERTSDTPHPGTKMDTVQSDVGINNLENSRPSNGAGRTAVTLMVNGAFFNRLVGFPVTHTSCRLANSHFKSEGHKGTQGSLAQRTTFLAATHRPRGSAETSTAPKIQQVSKRSADTPGISGHAVHLPPEFPTFGITEGSPELKPTPKLPSHRAAAPLFEAAASQNITRFSKDGNRPLFRMPTGHQTHAATSASVQVEDEHLMKMAGVTFPTSASGLSHNQSEGATVLMADQMDEVLSSRVQPVNQITDLLNRTGRSSVSPPLSSSSAESVKARTPLIHPKNHFTKEENASMLQQLTLGGTADVHKVQHSPKVSTLKPLSVMFMVSPTEITKPIDSTARGDFVPLPRILNLSSLLPPAGASDWVQASSVEGHVEGTKHIVAASSSHTSIPESEDALTVLGGSFSDRLTATESPSVAVSLTANGQSRRPLTHIQLGQSFDPSSRAASLQKANAFAAPVNISQSQILTSHLYSGTLTDQSPGSTNKDTAAETASITETSGTIPSTFPSTPGRVDTEQQQQVTFSPQEKTPAASANIPRLTSLTPTETSVQFAHQTLSQTRSKVESLEELRVPASPVPSSILFQNGMGTTLKDERVSRRADNGERRETFDSGAHIHATVANNPTPCLTMAMARRVTVPYLIPLPTLTTPSSSSRKDQMIFPRTTTSRASAASFSELTHVLGRATMGQSLPAPTLVAETPATPRGHSGQNASAAPLKQYKHFSPILSTSINQALNVPLDQLQERTVASSRPSNKDISPGVFPFVGDAAVSMDAGVLFKGQEYTTDANQVPLAPSTMAFRNPKASSPEATSIKAAMDVMLPTPLLSTKHTAKDLLTMSHDSRSLLFEEVSERSTVALSQPGVLSNATFEERGDAITEEMANVTIKNLPGKAQHALFSEIFLTSSSSISQSVGRIVAAVPENKGKPTPPFCSIIGSSRPLSESSAPTLSLNISVTAVPALLALLFNGPSVLQTSLLNTHDSKLKNAPLRDKPRIFARTPGPQAASKSQTIYLSNIATENSQSTQPQNNGSLPLSQTSDEHFLSSWVKNVRQMPSVSKALTLHTTRGEMLKVTTSFTSSKGTRSFPKSPKGQHRSLPSVPPHVSATSLKTSTFDGVSLNNRARTIAKEGPVRPVRPAQSLPATLQNIIPDTQLSASNNSLSSAATVHNSIISQSDSNRSLTFTTVAAINDFSNDGATRDGSPGTTQAPQTIPASPSARSAPVTGHLQTGRGDLSTKLASIFHSHLVLTSITAQPLATSSHKGLGALARLFDSLLYRPAANVGAVHEPLSTTLSPAARWPPVKTAPFAKLSTLEPSLPPSLAQGDVSQPSEGSYWSLNQFRGPPGAKQSPETIKGPRPLRANGTEEVTLASGVLPRTYQTEEYRSNQSDQQATAFQGKLINNRVAPKEIEDKGSQHDYDVKQSISWSAEHTITVHNIIRKVCVHSPRGTRYDGVSQTDSTLSKYSETLAYSTPKESSAIASIKAAPAQVGAHPNLQQVGKPTTLLHFLTHRSQSSPEPGRSPVLRATRADWRMNGQGGVPPLTALHAPGLLNGTDLLSASSSPTLHGIALALLTTAVTLRSSESPRSWTPAPPLTTRLEKETSWNQPEYELMAVLSPESDSNRSKRLELQKAFILASRATFNGTGHVSDDNCGSGNYVVRMNLGLERALRPGDLLNAQEDLYVTVALETNDSRVVLALPSCCLSPTSRPEESNSVCCIFTRSFICQHVHLIQNRHSTSAAFTIQIFEMANYSSVYLHCKVSICLRNDSDCIEGCSEPSPYRMEETIRSDYRGNVVSFGPLHRAMEDWVDNGTPGLTGLKIGMMFMGSLLAITLVLTAVLYLWVFHRLKANDHGDP